MGKREKMLVEAGFKIITTYPGAKWFAASDPLGEECALLCQSENCWHWFSRHSGATASSCNVARCHLENLSDAIGSDSQLNTYRKLLIPRRIPKQLRQYEGVYAAMGQVFVP